MIIADLFCILINILAGIIIALNYDIMIGGVFLTVAFMWILVFVHDVEVCNIQKLPNETWKQFFIRLLHS